MSAPVKMVNSPLAAILPKTAGYKRKTSERHIKDHSGVNIEFKRDANGKVSEAALNDDGTVLVLKKK